MKMFCEGKRAEGTPVTGTHVSTRCIKLVRNGTERQGLQVGAPDEVAFHLKWITKDHQETQQNLQKINMDNTWSSYLTHRNVYENFIFNSEP